MYIILRFEISRVKLWLSRKPAIRRSFFGGARKYNSARVRSWEMGTRMLTLALLHFRTPPKKERMITRYYQEDSMCTGTSFAEIFISKSSIGYDIDFNSAHPFVLKQLLYQPVTKHFQNYFLQHNTVQNNPTIRPPINTTTSLL